MSTWAGVTSADRMEAVRSMCFCLLYDLCCWLAGSVEPVPEETGEYSLSWLRQTAHPRERLAAYASGDLLRSWELALQPFFNQGAALEPQLGESSPLEVGGLEQGGAVQAELRFSSRSRVWDRQGTSHQLPPREWALALWLSPDLGRVESAALREVRSRGGNLGSLHAHV